jgi:hypothetical protein
VHSHKSMNSRWKILADARLRGFPLLKMLW